MNEEEIDKLYFDLEPIEAVLSIFSSLEQDANSIYVSILAADYWMKIVQIRNQLKKKLENLPLSHKKAKGFYSSIIVFAIFAIKSNCLFVAFEHISSSCLR